MAKRMQHCFYCGEEQGIFEAWHGDVITCGKLECEREAREVYRARDEEARYAAEQDDYDRYR